MRQGGLKILVVLLLVLILVPALLGCATKKIQAEGKLKVAVSILPQAEFVAAVGGDKVAVIVMMPPGAEAHTYEPRPSQIAALAAVRMYAKVGSGIEFELVWLDKLAVTNHQMLVVDCAQDIPLMELTDSGSDGGQHRGTLDPHIWLSPRNAQIMVRNIAAGLAQIDPTNSAYYEQNRDAYLQQLIQLDEDIRNSLSRVTLRRFIMYHPSLGYFARDYNLTLVAIEEEGKEPKAAAIARLIAYARQYNIKVIFASPQFNPESAKVIADAIGGRVVFFDSVAGNYIANLRTLLGELVQAMESGG